MTQEPYENDPYHMFEMVDEQVGELRENPFAHEPEELRQGLFYGFFEAMRVLYPPRPRIRKSVALEIPYPEDVEDFCSEQRDQQPTREEEKKAMAIKTLEREEKYGSTFGNHLHQAFEAIKPRQGIGCNPLTAPVALVGRVFSGGERARRAQYEAELSALREIVDMEEAGEDKDKMNKAIVYLKAAAAVMRAEKAMTSAEALATAEKQKG